MTAGQLCSYGRSVEPKTIWDPIIDPAGSMRNVEATT
jgi:hypothetical protein